MSQQNTPGNEITSHDREALDRALHDLSYHIENTPLGMVEWDSDIYIRRWSKQAEAIFGWTAEETIGKKPPAFPLIHPESVETIRAITAELRDGLVSRNRMLARNLTKDGRSIYCEWYNSALRGSDGKLVSILSLVQDVTLRIEAEQQLREAAVHDTLTGLPNRLSLMVRLENAVTVAKRNQGLLALLFIDLNRFKPVNDRYGHAVGDKLLREVAARLRTCVREADTLARLGGDEFVVLLQSDVSRVTPAFTAQRIAEALQAPYNVDGHVIEIGASIGISLFPEDAEDADRLLARADAAMYRVKHGTA